jgi:hypothetical protein
MARLLLRSAPMRPFVPAVALFVSIVPTVALAETPAEMEPLTWLAVPDTKLQDVQSDPELYADLQGNGFWTIIEAWNGALLDTTRLRLVIWGGGHNDYYGNDMYAFDIASLSWSRLTEPTVEWTNCGDPNPDGTANSRHTYNGLAYIEHADRMFVSGGALNCLAGSCGAELTWEFDFDTLTWTDRQPSGGHSTGCGDNSAYDPATGNVYFGDAGGLYSYSYDDNAWTQLNQDSIYNVTSTIDTTRGQLVMVGEGEVWSYDIAGNDFERETWATTGGDAFIAGSAVGLTYDPTTDRIVGWSDGPVWVLDPVGREWTSYDVEGAPEPGINGIYGRWRYVPDVNAFILVTGIDDDVHFFKLSDGGTLPPPGGDDSGSGGADSGAEADSGADDATVGSASATADDGASVSASATADDGDSASASASADGSTGATESGAAQDDAGGCGCRQHERRGALVPLMLVAFALGVRRRM